MGNRPTFLYQHQSLLRWGDAEGYLRQILWLWKVEPGRRFEQANPLGHSTLKRESGVVRLVREQCHAAEKNL